MSQIGETVYNSGSGAALSVSFTSIKGLVYFTPTANFTLTLSNVPTTDTNITYSITLIYNAKFYANSININGTGYTPISAGPGS